MKYDATNEMFSLAVKLVNESSRDIFLTGKAGTGKTTFLKYIRETCPKQMAIVAPTGIAAINAGGVTIHSFFQLPLSPFVPDVKGSLKGNDGSFNRHTLIKRLQISSEKRKLLQQLELLVIDEVSMVRCDIVDAIDAVLRYVRKRPFEKFGGVQMLFIGDMFQLPPVIKDQDWNVLSHFYDGPYFFDSITIKEKLPVYIEFDKVYRQSEEEFLNLLNQVRNNEMNQSGLRLLGERYQPAFSRSENDGYIILTTHNESARYTNGNELAKLTSATFSYKAEINGDFPENAYPGDDLLQLKLGAQVMFIRNDLDKAKRYFNGKIGTVTELFQDSINVRCKGETDDIEVKRHEWENMRYTLDKSTRKLQEETLGSFIQYPLRLAWAITIHKSQGLTFDKAIIDIGEAFAPGQVYVALSRCTNLSGMVLKSKIRPNSLFIDPRIVEFSRNNIASAQLSGELATSKKRYQEKLLISSFDVRIAADICRELFDYLLQNKHSFNREGIAWLEEITRRLGQLQNTAERFHVWLHAQFEQPGLPEQNIALQERTEKAAVHFVSELSLLIESLHQCSAVTDSRLHAKEFNDELREIFTELSLKSYLLNALGGIPDAETWHTRRKNFALPPFRVNVYAGSGNQKSESLHPVLHQKLRKLRDAFCAPRDLPIYIVADSKTIDEMARYLPQSLEQLKLIRGFGDVKIERYGQDFLDVILEYCKERGLQSLIHERLPKPERKRTGNVNKSKSGTTVESFRLHKEGKTVAEIAKERNLTVQTIEGHLTECVERGDINITELASPQNLAEIELAIIDYEGGPITPIKEKLGSAISFGEIRFVLAWKKYQKNQQGSLKQEM